MKKKNQPRSGNTDTDIRKKSRKTIQKERKRNAIDTQTKTQRRKKNSRRRKEGTEDTKKMNECIC